MDQNRNCVTPPRQDGYTNENPNTAFIDSFGSPNNASSPFGASEQSTPLLSQPCRRSVPYYFSQPHPKRLCTEERNFNDASWKTSVLGWKRQKLDYISGKYNDNLIELFLVENNINLLDMHSCIKNSSPQLVNYIKANKLIGDDSWDDKINILSPVIKIKEEPSHVPLASVKSLKNKQSKSFAYFGGSSTSDVYSENSTYQQEQIIEKARQEAYVIQRITALRKDGMWGEKRLPKVQEPSRPKAHWDYLLEEMVWLSADFVQERKWKKVAAKKCAKMVQKYFQDKNQQALKAEKEHELKLRKIAAFIAREIRTFWGNIGKLIEFKVNTRLDEKKKIALDQQLSFIVDQTEKYSSMLAESMKKAESSTTVSQSPILNQRTSDDEFLPCESSSDDEETIAKEEDNPEEQASEVQLLKKESEKSLEDVLNELPPNYFKCSSQSSSEVTDEPSEYSSKPTSGTVTPVEKSNSDQDFEAKESSEDDEATIEEQEKNEDLSQDDHQHELLDLEMENQMSVEELRKKYEGLVSAGAASANDSDDDSDAGSNYESSVMSDGSFDELSGSSDGQIGLEDLVDQSFTEMDEASGAPMTKERSEEVDKELNDASAMAQSLQPKGFTLSSTTISTTVPFLLKHTLREYQHVGLDWLVTMYEKKLNGILADEMGLGKTIQTIALLAHLACEKEIWGPHLIVVPTSVMLNWEMELKKWCPAFKILTYYGSQKERRMKRQGWTKSDSFHVCITSYKLVIQDHQSFRRKKWRYLILDEAQNIKNFKSQRWQLLLNFQSHRRLLLTGTPLQNNLMELWSLMHFLMPNIFASHREFREWFSNPVTGMIEGNKEYNDSIIKRLHKVLRPFILRRLKTEVEQQMPKKYEHVVMCRLSKRQRFLYEEFMSRTKTKETLASGNFLSVINVLMQLRKVCNHPNLFESRPTISPFMMDSLSLACPSLVYNALVYDPFRHVDLFSLNLLLSKLEFCLTAFAAHRIRRFQAAPKLICEIDEQADKPPKCPAGKIRLHVRPSNQPLTRPVGASKVGGPSIVTLKPVVTSASSTPNTSPSLQSGVRFQLVQHGGSYKAIPLPAGSTGGMLMQQTSQGPRLVVPPRVASNTSGSSKAASGSTPSAVNSATAGPMGPNASSSSQAPSQNVTGLQLVQTSSGQYLLTSSPVQKSSNAAATPTSPAISLSGNTAMALLQRLQGLKGLQGSVITTGAGGRPVLRLPTSSLRSGIAVTNTTAASALVSSTSSSCSLPTTKITSISSNSQMDSSPSKTASAGVASSSAAPSPATSPLRLPQTRSQTSEPKEEEWSQAASKKKEDVANKGIFHITELEEEIKLRRQEKLRFISVLNTRRCHACPIYGSDLIEAVTFKTGFAFDAAETTGFHSEHGSVHVLKAASTSSDHWDSRRQTFRINDFVRTPTQCLSDLKVITDRFLFCVPPVVASRGSCQVAHPNVSKYSQESLNERILCQNLRQPLIPLHPIINAATTQFPDPRLIQYDCGKLQTLDVLLRQLKRGHHRVLIFTQMTRMLDVFESFLNFHGHLYLRLDGATKIEQRQALMERFNQDKRIFVFILSTRSGGIGVNLTGADTVIFYDSDWNPTMDAQAQDRCHRIGQTRDVHIYRLISERTVEENILKKANQKRLLGDLAIEGGNFTTASLKKTTIRDIFEVESSATNAAKPSSQLLREDSNESEPEKDSSRIGLLENALASAEDERDAEATRLAKAEAAAELTEFDEEHEHEDATGKAEHEVALLMKQLTPIERYAMNFLEESDDVLIAEVERLSAQIEEQKKEWELERMQTLREEERRLKEIDQDDELLTYSSINAYQMWVSYNNESHVMPIWRPPTPPREETDLYVDRSLEFWYDPSSVMNESDLPPIYLKRENKRIKIEPSAVGQNEVTGQICGSPSSDSSSNMMIRGSVKVKREDSSFAPRSLFERKEPKKDLKLFKYRTLARPSSLAGQLIGKASASEPPMEWLIHEDWAIVQAIQQILNLCLNLTVVSLAHIPNWDLVCDLVNSFSVCYRSQRQCRNRYENVLLLREETKESGSDDTALGKKVKKQKLLGGATGSRQNMNSRGMGTFQLFQQDNNSKFSSLCSTRFETIKSITVKKNPTMKPMHVNPTTKNAKHAQILADHGIEYEEPLSPSQVATNRAERIQCEKQKQKSQLDVTHHQTRLQIHQNQNQMAVSQLQRQLQQAHQGQQIAFVAATVASCGQQQQPVIVSSGTLSTKGTSSVVLNQGIANNIVTAISVSGSAVSPSIPAIVTSTTTVTTAHIIGGIRTTVASSTSGSLSSNKATLTLQDLQPRSSTIVQPTVVSVAGLTQLHNAKLAAFTTQAPQQRVAGVPVQTRALIPQQMQYIRHAQRGGALALHSAKVVATSTTGDQTIKRVQITGQTSTGQKVQVAGVSGTGTTGVPASGITAIQMVKPSNVVGPVATCVSSVVGGSGAAGATKTVTRTVTETEMNALLRRQPQQIAKVGQIAQMIAKQRSLAGLKGTTVGLQLGSKGGLGGTGMSTVQIVQGGNQKQMTVQQIQQVFKQVQQQQSQMIHHGTISGAVVGKAISATSSMSGVSAGTSTPQATKLVPVTVTTQQQPIKQTIQVVAGASNSSNGNSRVSSSDRSSAFTVQGNAVRVGTPAVLSLGPTALHGQPVSVAVRNTAPTPVRIQTSSAITSVPSSQITQSTLVCTSTMPSDIETPTTHSNA